MDRQENINRETAQEPDWKISGTIWWFLPNQMKKGIKRPWEILNAVEADKSWHLWHFPHAHKCKVKLTKIGKDSFGETLIDFNS